MMPKFLVDLWLDGYETEDEQVESCMVFLDNQLDFSASSVHITHIPDSVDTSLGIEKYLNLKMREIL